MENNSSACSRQSEPILICQLESVQGLVDAITSIKWKKQQVFSIEESICGEVVKSCFEQRSAETTFASQDAVCEFSEHGMLVVSDDAHCLQARAYFRKEVCQYWPLCLVPGKQSHETAALQPL